MAQFIRQHNPYAIIVFVTSHSEFATLTFKYKVSALDFIDKDINDNSFKKRVKDCIVYTRNNLIENTDIVDFLSIVLEETKFEFLLGIFYILRLQEVLIN